MSATLEATRPTKKKFGKSEREVPHHTHKAKKWYPAEDEIQPKKVGRELSDSLLVEVCRICGPGIAVVVVVASPGRRGATEMRVPDSDRLELRYDDGAPLKPVS